MAELIVAYMLYKMATRRDYDDRYYKNVHYLKLNVFKEMLKKSYCTQEFLDRMIVESKNFSNKRKKITKLKFCQHNHTIGELLRYPLFDINNQIIGFFMDANSYLSQYVINYIINEHYHITADELSVLMKSDLWNDNFNDINIEYLYKYSDNTYAVYDDKIVTIKSNIDKVYYNNTFLINKENELNMSLINSCNILRNRRNQVKNF